MSTNTDSPSLWESSKQELKTLLKLRPHKRPKSFLLMAALAVSAPAFIGAWLQVQETAIIACLGGLVMLYMRPTPLMNRMITLSLCSFGFSLCFVLGLLTSFNPFLSALSLFLSSLLAISICRYYQLPPPGMFFFVVVACLGRTLEFDLSLVAERTGVLLFGCIGACVIGLLYSVTRIYLLKKPKQQLPEPLEQRVEAAVIESAVIALFIAGGYWFAMLIALENPYWVPISCAAIMQGLSFREVRLRNIHRILGTMIGLTLTWGIFSLSPNPWMLALLIMLLSFVIELLIARNYGLAVIFITPLTIIFADATTLAHSTEALLQARLFDIVLGSCIGLLGGWVLYHPKFFMTIERTMVKWRQR